MNRKTYFKLSLICYCIAVAMFLITYFTFHYITDSGITLIKQEEAGKPLVTNMLGEFGVLMFFAGTIFLILAFTMFKKNKEKLK